MSKIQEKLFKEIKDDSLFEKSLSYSKEYIAKIFDRDVYPSDQAIKDLDVFDSALPVDGLDGHHLIEHLNTFGSPATNAQLGGRYFGFVNGSAVPAGIAAKQLATTWDQNSGLQIISPICAKLESVVEKWINKLFDLDDKCVSGFVTGTSAANFCSLAAARYRILKNQGWDVNKKGLWNAPRVRIVAGKQANSSVLKAVNMNGFGQESIEWVDVDHQGRMLVDSLPALDNTCLVLLQAGNVNSGAFDDFDNICTLANNAGSWVHIDGAFGLWAPCSSSLKHWTNGIAKADSLAVDGHKTLNTPYDCGIVICKDKDALSSAMHMSASYIMQNQERDGMYYTADMSRRSRVIELWATICSLGIHGIDEMVTSMHEKANLFADLLSSADGFTVLNEIDFNQIVVCCNSDELTSQVMQHIQQSGDCWVGHAMWKNKRVIRISICSWATTKDDINRSFNAFKTALEHCTTS